MPRLFFIALKMCNVEVCIPLGISHFRHTLSKYVILKQL